MKQSTYKLRALTSVAFLSAMTLSGCNSNDIKIDIKEPASNQTYDQYISEQAFSGAVLIANNDQILLSKGFGKANKEQGSDNTSETIFRLGSVTKQFTAVAILQLQEQGKISLSDTVDTFVEDYPRGDEITVKQLLNHTSGIPNFTSFSSYNDFKYDYHTPEQLINRFKSKSLKFTPGSQFDYSNSNYALLGFIVEKASGENYQAYIENNIFSPLAMNNSEYGTDALGDNNVAQGYQLFTKVKEISMSVPYAAGALSSSVDDLYKWHMAIKNNTLINEYSTNQMFTPAQNGYALGWAIQTRGAQTVQLHSGGVTGFSSYLIRSEDDKKLVIVLANDERFPASEMGNYLYDMIP